MSDHLQRSARYVSFSAFLGLVFGATFALATADAAQPSDRLTTRRVVLEATSQGHRWNVVTAAVPEPGEHDVLVRVRAVALNRGDFDAVQRARSNRVGRVVASDAAGQVVAMGSKVQGLRKGQRVVTLYFRDWPDGPPSEAKQAAVLGANVDGVFSDYLVLPETALAPAPELMSDEEAATLPTAGLTAWMATIGEQALAPAPRSTVLVQGTGGVSTFALQFARLAGARVIVTSSSDAKLERARELGASAGINYRTHPEWSKQVLALTEGLGADLVIDVGGKATLEQSMAALAYRGRLAIVGGLTGYDGAVPALPLLDKHAHAIGVYVGSRADFLRMSEFVTKHRFRPVIERIFPFERRDEALALLGSGDFVGKIVIRL
jgi:NADPH:quinone reductase-like Zn-dependent oxidoreductase